MRPPRLTLLTVPSSDARFREHLERAIGRALLDADDVGELRRAAEAILRETYHAAAIRDAGLPGAGADETAWIVERDARPLS